MKNIRNHFKKHILHNHIFHLILWVFFGIWLIIRVLYWSAQTTDPFFPFNTFISNHNNTTNISFQYWWNSLSWILAWSWWTTLTTPENISITWSTTSISCSKKLEWLYYNAIRWSKLWPLDDSTLQKLKEIDPSYNWMVVEWWLFTDCVGTNISSNFVIWQINHYQWWLRYTIFAGLHYNLVDNSLNTIQDLNWGTLTFQNNAFQWRIFDVHWGWIWDLSTQTTPWSITIWGFSWAVFFPGISSVTNADTKKLYSSSSFSVVWLTWPTVISITSWALLYINGSWVWISWIINNNYPLRIEMFSSDQYDSSVSSYIKVGNLSWVFTITTKPKQPDVCMLTKEEKEEITTVFSWLLEQYWTTSKLTTLMNTMKSMINDMQDFNYDCNLEYLESLVEKYLEDILWWWSENTHIAPNCKKYTIVYNEDKKGYTSTNLKVRQYFATRQSLIKFIDSKNPWDCNISIYYDDEEDYQELDDNMYIAPNWKVYEIEENLGIYSSPTMTIKKQFSSRDALLQYIDKSNPAIEVWDHKVDTSRNPIIYAASNSKEYKIYKTDKWFMSYKLVKVRYFQSQEEIIAYIESNNKK